MLDSCGRPSRFSVTSTPWRWSRAKSRAASSSMAWSNRGRRPLHSGLALGRPSVRAASGVPGRGRRRPASAPPSSGGEEPAGEGVARTRGVDHPVDPRDGRPRSRRRRRAPAATGSAPRLTTSSGRRDVADAAPPRPRWRTRRPARARATRSAKRVGAEGLDDGDRRHVDAAAARHAAAHVPAAPRVECRSARRTASRPARAATSPRPATTGRRARAATAAPRSGQHRALAAGLDQHDHARPCAPGRAAPARRPRRPPAPPTSWSPRCVVADPTDEARRRTGGRRRRRHVRRAAAARRTIRAPACRSPAAGGPSGRTTTRPRRGRRRCTARRDL